MTSWTFEIVNLDPKEPKKVWKEEEEDWKIPRLIMITMYVKIENEIEKWRKEWFQFEEMLVDYLAFFLGVWETIRF